MIRVWRKGSSMMRIRGDGVPVTRYEIWDGAKMHGFDGLRLSEESTRQVARFEIRPNG